MREQNDKAWTVNAPSSSGVMHSYEISNWNGFGNRVGLSSTVTLVTCTADMLAFTILLLLYYISKVVRMRSGERVECEMKS